ncbi:MAG: hypothetical protein AB1571_03205 [Nanoarchaeota archaeon]
MVNVDYDWIKGFIDPNFIDRDFFANKDRITVNKIARLFSQQLRSLKIDEKRFRRMVKR